MAKRPTYDEMAAIVPRLNASPAARNLMEAFPRTIEFTIPSEQSRFFVRIEGGQITLHDNFPNNSDLVVIVSDGPRFIHVLRGGLDISHPVAEGRLTVERGRLSEMILLNRILAVAQKGKSK